MSWTIDTAFVHEFENRIYKKMAENPTMWRSAVRVKNGVRGKSYNVERLGSIEMVTINTRHGDTILTPLRHSRRRLTLTDKGASELIDDLDEVKMLINPESDYAARFAEAFNRFVADMIIAALNGNSIAVAADDTQTNVGLSQGAVDPEERPNAGPGANIIAGGGTGLTMAKLRSANRVLGLNNASSSIGERFIAVSPWAIEDLLADTTVTSSDFSNLHALQSGSFGPDAMWMGFRWIVSNQLPLAADGTTRSALAWHKNSVVLGIAREFQTEIDKRADKWNSTQVMVKVSLGAVRVEEEAVVRIDYTEA